MKEKYDEETHSRGVDETLLPTRREFLGGALAASGAAIAGAAVSSFSETAQAQAGPVPLRQIGEIHSEKGRLQAVITVRNAEMSAPGSISQKPMLRYFTGKGPDGKIWPPPPEQGAARVPLPGPTLRARVGDHVEITYLNHIHVGQYPGGTIDRAEQGVEGCDSTVSEGGVRVYPESVGDAAPNCFHASSTVNLHFHGTHITPDGLGDNVLLQLRPNPEVIEASVHRDFEEIFRRGRSGKSLANWNDLPWRWTARQLWLLKDYDRNAPWQGRRGLPRDKRLRPVVDARISRGLWPQYQVGAYPFCFKLTEYTNAQGARTGYAMGQCPGTHWYHAHKHGSTAINVFNGMAGVFVIEGAYDDALEKIYPDLKKTQKVLIVQQFNDMPNRMRPASAQSGSPPPLSVNGQINPIISMQPGEVQLWRLVNATVQAVSKLDGFRIKPEFKQIAQDGVQYRWENFEAQPILTMPFNQRFHTFSPGNRVDILVKAPQLRAPGEAMSFAFELESPGRTVLLTLKVEGSPVSPEMNFPRKGEYPAFPEFLEDIKEDRIRIRWTVDFTEEERGAPHFGMDGRKFAGGRYDQTMVLGDREEWTIRNHTGSVAHPFHIHVNPFQVVEIFDPASNRREDFGGKNFVWRDTISVPAKSGGVPGEVKIRHAFVDFAGSYVMHCHILAHEDRGMMQLVRVIKGNDGDETAVPHH